MEAFAPPSATPSHYSKEAIGLIMGACFLFLVLCIVWTYIHYHGGPTKMLLARRERHEARCKARDIEMARTADSADRFAVDKYKRMIADKKAQEASKQANETVTAVCGNNTLVGDVRKLPKLVDLNEEWQAKQKGFDENL